MGNPKERRLPGLPSTMRVASFGVVVLTVAPHVRRGLSLVGSIALNLFGAGHLVNQVVGLSVGIVEQKNPQGEVPVLAQHDRP